MHGASTIGFGDRRAGMKSGMFSGDIKITVTFQNAVDRNDIL
jgi:hypothetical protein